MWPADLRLGAGVGSKLFEELAVSFIPHQGEFSNELRGANKSQHKKPHKTLDGVDSCKMITLTFDI